MAISKRLAETQPNRSNTRGCETCIWLSTLKKDDRDSFEHWLTEGYSVMQLHEICSTDPDHPLRVSYSAFRGHIKKCHESE